VRYRLAILFVLVGALVMRGAPDVGDGPLGVGPLLHNRPATPELAAGTTAPTPTPTGPPAQAPPPRQPKDGPAYWFVGADGGVFPYGRGGFAGSVAAASLNGPVVSVVPSGSGNGYALAAADGGVFAFGDAPYLGSPAGHRLNRPVTSMAPTPSHQGYWILTADGGVFAYGDAAFYGSLSKAPPRAPVIGLVPTPSGRGYWLISADGGVFTYGDAGFRGSLASTPLNAPIVGAAVTPSGGGYWMVSADGGVFAFGDAPYQGSPVTEPLRARIIGISPTRSGQGYWLASADGGVFTYGDAGFYGSLAPAILNRPVTAFAAGAGSTIPPRRTGLSGPFGYDISFPECDGRMPPASAFVVVGVTGGKMFTANPCVADQFRKARSGTSVAGVYVNVNAPEPEEMPYLARDAGERCHAGDGGCHLREWGRRGAVAAFNLARHAGISSPMWWLDVETLNTWLPDTNANAIIVQGAIDALRHEGVGVGIYSTYLMYPRILGGWNAGLPVWVAGPADGPSAQAACSGSPFGGGQPWLVQYPHDGLDGDLICPAASPGWEHVFHAPPPLPVPEFPA
jgi:hypothetical protein